VGVYFFIWFYIKQGTGAVVLDNLVFLLHKKKKNLCLLSTNRTKLHIDIYIKINKCIYTFFVYKSLNIKPKDDCHSTVYTIYTHISIIKIHYYIKVKLI
jgi:hypothetical protein